MKGDKIVQACGQHSNKTVTLRKHITNYKSLQKLMVKFLRKSGSCGNKIAEVNSIYITKSINLTLILYGVGVGCDVDIFKLTAHVQSIYREVNICNY